jgi:hypothetical protein
VTIDLEKTSAKVKAVVAVFALIGITNFGDLVRMVRGFFGARVSETPALKMEIKARIAGDSALGVAVDTVRYELKRVKTQNIRFQAAQVESDPKLRESLERMNSESRTSKARRERTEKLLEGLAE